MKQIYYCQHCHKKIECEPLQKRMYIWDYNNKEVCTNCYWKLKYPKTYSSPNYNKSNFGETKTATIVKGVGQICE